MRDILADLEAWRQQGEQIGIATVVETWGSSPRPVGSKLAVNLNRGITGSVSAGCVENAVIEAAQEAARTGQARLLTYGVAKETALDVGLTCGGTLKVLVQPFTAFSSTYEALRPALEAQQPFGVIHVVEGPAETLNRTRVLFADGRSEGDLDLPDHLSALTSEVQKRLDREGGLVTLGDLTFFLDIQPRTPRLVVIGAVHITAFLASIAAMAGFQIIVVDPRGAFATEERFPPPVTLIRQWPQEALPALALDEGTYVVALSHDPKLDDPALVQALASPARYVGALGSRRSALVRLQRLKEEGLTDAQLARLHSPVGLPLGGRSAVEIALSIAAHLVQVRNQD